MPTFTPPTVSYPWPTGNRFVDRIKVPRGISVISDFTGGWYSVEFPFAGVLEGITEGTDYFLGGHVYPITDDIAASLIAAGFSVTS